MTTRMLPIAVVFALVPVLARAQGSGDGELSLREAMAVYRQRAARMGAGDAQAHVDLALFCRAHMLRRTARRELVTAIRLDPDNEQAHVLLGHARIDGKWLSEREAHEAQGHVRWKGEWRTRAEVARLKRQAAEKKRAQRLQRDIDRLARRLSGSSEKRRLEARDGLVAIARRERLPRLEKVARQAFAYYHEWWVAYRHQALVEVRATEATLTGLRSRSVSLGTGTPVTLELPEVRTVRIGTTVGVPLGH